MNKTVICLDKGYVQLISQTPDADLLVVNAARASFGKQHIEFDEEKDTKLITYLAKHKHMLPFRHPSITLRVYMPIFVARQLMKHSVGMSCSEVSRRYITGEPEFYSPLMFRERPEDIKQGSVESSFPMSKTWDLYDQYTTTCRESVDKYKMLLKAGVAPEQARGVLPQSMYTTVVWTGTLQSWFHLWDMRTDLHAQKESQNYGWAVGKLMQEICPVSWKALCLHGSTYPKENRKPGVLWFEEYFN